MSDAVRIASLEAKDIYNAAVGACGETRDIPLYYPDGTPRYRVFSNSLDNSLDLMKLKEIYSKVYRKKDFSEEYKGQEYSRHVINVKFGYSHRLFNRSSGGVYIAEGYSLPYVKERMSGSILIENGRPIAVRTDTPSEYSEDIKLFSPYFGYKDGAYRLVSGSPVIMSSAKLREYLYENGFECGGIRYVRWKRSSGSSRVGKCLFINEKLYERMHKWECCGIEPEEGSEVDLAAFEAYIALTASSITDTLELPPESFLIIPDHDSVFTTRAANVTYENGVLSAKEENVTVSNSIFDGQSLLDISAFPEKYKKRSMLLLRQRMFKSAAFKCDIQRFFRDNGITEISQLSGITLARDIGEIKIITTPSSIKYTKFGGVKKWLRKLESVFGIVKYEKSTRHFSDGMVSCHYQLINSLRLSQGQVKELLRPAFEYISSVRDEPAVLKHHLSLECGTARAAYTKNDMIFGLMSVNEKFSDTGLYREFRQRLVRAMIRELKRGHIPINGNYSVMLGSGVEMLLQSIGRFDGKGILGEGRIYTERFPFGKKLLGSRSPHVCAGNIFIAENTDCELIRRYFPLSKEVVYVDAANNNLLQRLNGADFDSDSLLLTDNEILLEAAQRGYDIFTVPTNSVYAEKTKRHYTKREQCELDIKTSVNRIGEIINLSQLLNSIYWENINSGRSHERNRALYLDICSLAVLSNIEIDRAKKEFGFDTAKELAVIKKRHCVKENGRSVKPMFFKMIAEENGFGVSELCVYRYFDTAMDKVYGEVSRFGSARSLRTLPQPIALSALAEKCARLGRNAGYQKRDKALEYIRSVNAKLCELYSGYDEKNREEREEINDLAEHMKIECMSVFNSLVNSEKTAFLILKAIEEDENRDIRHRVLRSAFGSTDTVFYKIMSEEKASVRVLVPDKNGDIDIFGRRYRIGSVGDAE